MTQLSTAIAGHSLHSTSIRLGVSSSNSNKHHNNNNNNNYINNNHNNIHHNINKSTKTHSRQQKAKDELLQIWRRPRRYILSSIPEEISTETHELKELKEQRKLIKKQYEKKNIFINNSNMNSVAASPVRSLASPASSSLLPLTPINNNNNNNNININKYNNNNCNNNIINKNANNNGIFTRTGSGVVRRVHFNDIYCENNNKNNKINNKNINKNKNNNMESPLRSYINKLLSTILSAVLVLCWLLMFAC